MRTRSVLRKGKQKKNSDKEAIPDVCRKRNRMKRATFSLLVEHFPGVLAHFASLAGGGEGRALYLHDAGFQRVNLVLKL